MELIAFILAYTLLLQLSTNMFKFMKKEPKIPPEDQAKAWIRELNKEQRGLERQISRTLQSSGPTSCLSWTSTALATYLLHGTLCAIRPYCLQGMSWRRRNCN